MSHIFLYGAPGSGKTTIGRALAKSLDLPFSDLDDEIVTGAGRTIAEIMSDRGEEAFRELETSALEVITSLETRVIALGGGALLRDKNRKCAESVGKVIFLQTDPAVLLERLNPENGIRPLLAGDKVEKLKSLLERRRSHYDSFKLRIANESSHPDETVRKIQLLLGRFHLPRRSGGYDILIEREGLNIGGEKLEERHLTGPMAIVTDSHVGPLYAESLLGSLKRKNIRAAVITIPAGEKNKTLRTVSNLWKGFLQSGLDRKSTVIALGGGVTGDLTGFAASAFMRGMAWAVIPTSLLAMVDSSMGGKTGFDLPYGKNLVGSFHSPKLVLTDPNLLSTLPAVEFRSGLAEVVKHGVISDPILFTLCSHGERHIRDNLDEIITRAIAVKVGYISEDPFENGSRAVLNYGHTVGHAIELVSGFRLRHGEAVAIGMVVEAKAAEKISLAPRGLSNQIANTLAGLGLPIKIPQEMASEKILEAIKVDKKKRDGRIRFALPMMIGKVRTGVEIDNFKTILEEE
jgi:shikimate kinase/3-dehydroquinate synthase